MSKIYERYGIPLTVVLNREKETTVSLAGSEAPPAPASAAPRLEFIDGLRGVAMLMVLLFHSYTFGGQWKIMVPLLHGHSFNLCSVFGVGSVGVSLFLVLSGFCLFWPFARTDSAAGKPKPDPTLKAFAYRRCRRILPPYYFALVLFTVLAVIQRHMAAMDAATAANSDPMPSLVSSFLLHIAMLQNMRPQYFYDINGSFWSLALEFHLYILFPLLVVAFRRFPQRAILVFLFLFTCLFRLFALKTANMDANDSVAIITYSVFGRCFEFALGMYAAVLVARSASRREPGGAPVFTRADIVFAAVLFLAAVVGYKRGYAEVFKATVTGLLFVSILLAGSCRGSLLHRLLSAKYLVALGTISYSIYLIHHPIVTTLGAFAAAHGFTNVENILFMWGFVMPLCLLIGAIYYRYIEKPFVGAPRRSPQPASPAALSERPA